MADAMAFMDVLLPVLWIALVVAIAVFALALLYRLAGLLARLLAPWVGPRVRHLSRARAGVAEDAPRWACHVCHSVNEPIARDCYRCGAPAGEDSVPLPDGAGDELWRPSAPASHFDPALYQGPGAPVPGGRAEPCDVAREDVPVGQAR